MGLPSVSIIILNWNGWRDTIECLDSLRHLTYPNYEIVLIENASENDSVSRIRSYCEGKQSVDSNSNEHADRPELIEVLEYSRTEAETGGDPQRELQFNRAKAKRKLKLILNENNLGFAGGNNVGMRYVLASTNPDYVLLLNNDTVVSPIFLTRLVETAEGDKTIGFAGPKIYFYDMNGRKDVIFSAGGKLNVRVGRGRVIGLREIDVGQYATGQDLDYAGGSCLLARSEMIEQVGMLDESFFLYWEETDWCFRARRVGYRTVYVPDSVIWHKRGASMTGKTEQFYLTRNSFWFMKKNATKGQYFWFLVYFAVSHCFRIPQLLLRGDFEGVSAFARGILDGLRESVRTEHRSVA